MKRNSKFNKLNEWIKTEYDKETKEIENSLSNDGSFNPNKVNSEELLQRIQNQIAEMENLDEETRAQKKPVRIAGYSVRKWIALFFVAITGVFLASMTSEANRSHLMYTVEYLLGNEVTVDEGNDGNMNDITNWQKGKLNRQEAEDKLGIPIPIFHYMMESNTNNTYDIQCGNTIATTEYLYKDHIVNLRMFNKNKADVSGIDFEGHVIKELNLINNTVNISVLEVEGTEDKFHTLAAQWEYKEGYYQLSGKVKKTDFYKILKSIVY